MNKDDLNEELGENEVDDIVYLQNEDGEETPFVVIATLKLDDTDYALLAEQDNLDEVMVFRLVEQDGELVFEGVDDDDEIDEVLLAINE